ncbi:MAG: hypothetical protein OXN95_11620, partial [bacterium]|nr:hypothetical protein [bacterium]
MADVAGTIAGPGVPEVSDPEKVRRARLAREGGFRLIAGVALLLVQLLVTYDGVAWLQVILALGGIYGILTGVGQLIRAAFGSRVEPTTWISMAWLFVLLLFVFLQLAGFFNDLSGDVRNLERHEIPPSFTTDEPLGTDQLGKSILAQSIRGARISLIVGLGAVGIGLAVGSVIGLAAGYFRGFIEGTFNIITDSVLAFPALILLFSIVAIFGGSVLVITLALSVLSIPTIGRLSRANTLTFAAR